MPTTPQRSAVTAFAPEPTSATAARRFVRQTLESSGIAQTICDRAELIASELVTNAVLHAGTGPTVSIRIDGQVVRITVEDTSPVAPVLREYGLDAATGRGLRVVSSAATEWGVETTQTGKSVWALLDAALNEPFDPRLAPTASPQFSFKNVSVPRSPNALDALTKPTTHRVEFINVPVNTYIQLEAHNESLVREFSLLNIQVTGDEEKHMPKELRDAVLFASTIDTRFTLLRSAARVAQRENQDAFSMTLQLPTEAATQLEKFAEWAALADELGNNQLLLTGPATEPVRLLRDWLVREAIAQIRGSSQRVNNRTPLSGPVEID